MTLVWLITLLRANNATISLQNHVILTEDFRTGKDQEKEKFKEETTLPPAKKTSNGTASGAYQQLDVEKITVVSQPEMVELCLNYYITDLSLLV